MTRSIRQSVLALLFALSVVMVPLAASPAQAASYTWVYVVINNSACNPYGANLQIRSINANITQTSWTVVNETPDNIVYPKVVMYRTNLFAATAKCYKKFWWGWQQVGIVEVWANIYPTRYQQTFWVG